MQDSRKLTYSNLSSKDILSKNRDIRFAQDDLKNAGSSNFLLRQLTLILDPVQIAMQADVFARGVLALGQKLYLKKTFGAERGDWNRQLHETFVYDKLRAAFYGYFDTKIDNLPNVKCFKGNLITRKFLTLVSHHFSEGSDNRMSIDAVVNVDDNFLEQLETVLNFYPNLRQGLNYASGRPRWVNHTYDGFLNGLHQEMTYFMSDSGNSQQEKDDLYEMTTLLNDVFTDQVMKEASNPLLNSVLNSKGDKFFFINPPEKNTDNSLKYNESIFLPRGIGLRADNLFLDGNPVYISVPRILDDPLTRFEVHAITGLKCDFIPNTFKEIDDYLGINTYDSNYSRMLFNEMLSFINSEESGGTADTP